MDNILPEMIEVPAVDGRPNCDLSCHNYEGLMCDVEFLIEHYLYLIKGEQTPKQARRWLEMNWGAKVKEIEARK